MRTTSSIAALHRGHDITSWFNLERSVASRGIACATVMTCQRMATEVVSVLPLANG